MLVSLTNSSTRFGCAAVSSVKLSVAYNITHLFSMRMQQIACSHTCDSESLLATLMPVSLTQDKLWLCCGEFLEALSGLYMHAV